MYERHILKGTGSLNCVKKVKTFDEGTFELKVVILRSHKSLLSRRYTVQVCCYVIGKMH